MFFHASEVQHGPHIGSGSGSADGGGGGGASGDSAAAAPDQQQHGRAVLGEIIQPGTPVEFTIVEGDPQQNRRTVAIEVSGCCPS